jgi:hypothetical protein
MLGLVGYSEGRAAITGAYASRLGVQMRILDRICFNRQKINLSIVSAGQSVGIKQVSDEIWLVTFMDYDLGYFDRETCRLEPIDNPFGPKVSPMSPV